jgi:hypothetical protein
LHNVEGDIISIFKDITKEGMEHFSGIFKEDIRATISKVIKMETFFPSFVSEEDNDKMMKEVTK